jgi:hypothetical protein
LGVDIIIDGDHRPKVLEVNDRLSLSVTVRFENDLKRNLLRETLFHISVNGTVLGEDQD